MSDSPRLGFRTTGKIKGALEEFASEQKIPLSQLLNHAVLVFLAGIDRVPNVTDWRQDKYMKPSRQLNKLIPVVTNWTEHIPEDLIKAVECRRW